MPDERMSLAFLENQVTKSAIYVPNPFWIVSKKRSLLMFTTFTSDRRDHHGDDDATPQKDPIRRSAGRYQRRPATTA